MNGEIADLIVTDPPYNVDYVGKTKDALKIQNDKMADNDFRRFLTNAFRVMDRHLKPGGAFYIWHADSEGYNFRGACQDAGWQVRQCLIWNKNTIVLGRQDYHWKHEPCLYGWKDGAAHYFIDDRTQATVIEDKGLDFKKMKKEELVALLKEIFSDKVSTTVINEDKPMRSAEHPTMKPLKLLERLIKNSSRPGELVLDTFGGSGSTMMTCEQLNRTCYIMEIDPVYCDVIVKRWENFTGRKAVLAE
jgi:site-specific DNA-methyltransferase (adenine-specific)